jgi:hypothetical protein
MNNGSNLAEEIFEYLTEGVLNSFAQYIQINENDEIEAVDPIVEFVIEKVYEYASQLTEQAMYSLQETSSDEEAASLLDGYRYLVEAYTAGLLDGLKQFVLAEVEIPKKVKNLLKYLGIGALGAGALAGAAYAGAHSNEIMNHLHHAKDAIQQKIQSLLQHIHGNADVQMTTSNNMQKM